MGYTPYVPPIAPEVLTAACKAGGFSPDDVDSGRVRVSEPADNGWARRFDATGPFLPFRHGSIVIAEETLGGGCAGTVEHWQCGQLVETRSLQP